VTRDLVHVAPSAGEWEMMLAQAEQLAASGLVPGQYRGHPENVVTAALMGRELGWGVTTAMRFVHVIDGKPSVSPEGMAALVRRAGHSIVGSTSSTAATVTGRRGDSGDEMTFTFTLDDAVHAGLCQLREGKPFSRSRDGKRLPWETYTQSMLWARALGQLCRMLFSDVLLGAAYVPEELGAAVDEDGAPIEVEVVEERQLADEPVLRELQARIEALSDDERDELRAAWKGDELLHGWKVAYLTEEQAARAAELLLTLSAHDDAGPQPETQETPTEGLSPQTTSDEPDTDDEATRQALSAAALHVQKLIAQLLAGVVDPVVEYVRTLHHQKVNSTLDDLGVDHDRWPIDLRRMVLTAHLLEAAVAEAAEPSP
jgi:hypothetical protein